MDYPLLSHIRKTTLAEHGFCGFLRYAKKTFRSEDNPDGIFYLGTESDYVAIIPDAVLSVTGECLEPTNSFGVRLWDLMNYLSFSIDDREFELENGDFIVNEDFYKQVHRLVNRARGVMKSLAAGSLIRRLTKGDRSGVMLVARGSEMCPYNEVHINPADAKNDLKDNELVLVARYPGAFCCTCIVKFNDKVPLGCVCTSIKVATSSMGDFDGDSLLICPIGKARLSGKVKDLVVDYKNQFMAA